MKFWLDELFVDANKQLPQILKTNIQCSSKKDKKFSKMLLALFNDMGVAEKALNYIGAEYSGSPTEIMIGGGLKYGYLSLYIFGLFSESIDFKVISPSLIILLDFIFSRAGLKDDADSCCYALKVSSKLVNDFIDTKAPNISLNGVLGEDFYYIELPKKFLLLDKYNIYCIFIHKSHILLVTDSPRPHLKYEIIVYEGFSSDEMVTGECSLLSLIFMDIKEHVFNLVKMIVLYHKSSNKRSKMVEVSQVSGNKEPLIDKRYKKLVKGAKRVSLKQRGTSSMFKLTYLNKPLTTKDWRNKSTNQARWVLNNKIDVIGHWRWQPHGENRLKRKLIYIQGHTRGSGEADPRAKMNLVC